MYQQKYKVFKQPCPSCFQKVKEQRDSIIRSFLYSSDYVYIIKTTSRQNMYTEGTYK